MGRPKKGEEKPDSLYEEIIQELEKGSSVREECRKRQIAPGSFFDRIYTRPKLEEMYAKAVAVKMDIWADEIIEIAERGCEALGVED